MRPFKTTILMVFGVLALALLVVFLPGNVSAALPPRPTLTPVPPTPTPVPPTATPMSENLAAIVLNAGYVYEGAWTGVQWQGGDGVWHDVEGWRGQIAGGQVRWGVAEKDFRTGPFRWLIYDGSGRERRATSRSFTLPGSPSQIVTVEVAAK